MVLICISQFTDTKHLFICLSAFQVLSSVKCKFMPFAHFSVWLFFMFLLICSSVILKINDSLIICAVNIFSSIIICIYSFLHCLLINGTFNFNIMTLSFFSLMVSDFCVLFIKCFPTMKP